MTMKLILLLMTLFLTSATTLSGAEAEKKAPDFTLKDLDGKDRSLSDFKGKIVVLEWINYECPFVKKHYGSGNMQALQKKYTGKGVVWLSICSSAPGKQGNLTLEQWRKRSKQAKSLATAILPDPTGATGKKYGAKTTPHMFVINAKGDLVYQGAIDDKRSWDPKTIKGATNYVAQALDATLKGDAVPTNATKSYGCSVKY
jgi:peroxiredoxin